VLLVTIGQQTKIEMVTYVGGNTVGSGRRPRQANATGKKTSASPVQRKRPGDKALEEIRRLQNTTTVLLPKLSFARVVRDVSDKLTPEGKRWQANALNAIHQAAEDYLIHLFEDAYVVIIFFSLCYRNLCAIHAKRVTIMIKVRYSLKMLTVIGHSISKKN
jgi:histone H3/H4